MIRILVDSASDILQNNQENILVVPLSVNINDKNYLDGVDLQHDEFYSMLVNTDTFPKTSQPTPLAFVKEFEKVKESGDELICILLSSGVSGTYQSAQLAKNIVEYDKIHLIDSLTGAYGVKLLVEETQKLINEGKTIPEIIESIEELKKHIKIYLSVDTLEYLHKGGRLDKKSAIIGEIAKIKPIITVTREGTIGVKSKAIGMVRAMNSIINIIEEVEVDTNHNVYTIYTSGTTNLDKFEKKLLSNNIQVNKRVQLGPVVGTHVGPEAFGIIFVSKN